MTAEQIRTVKQGLDMANSAVKVVAVIVGLVLAWSAVQGSVVRQEERTTRVEADLAKFKDEVKVELRGVHDKVQEIAVGVSVLVERTKKEKP